jgi:hypothetical protein
MKSTRAPQANDGDARPPWRLWAAWLAALGGAVAALVLLGCGGGRVQG